MLLNDKGQGGGDETVFGMNLSAFMLLPLTDLVLVEQRRYSEKFYRSM